MNQEEYRAEIEKLENRVWYSRKSRINAEARLISAESFVRHLNLYYAVWAIVVAIASLFFPTTLMQFLSVSLTVLLTVQLAYSTSLRYSERSIQMFNSYVAMDKILIDIRKLKIDENVDLEQLIEIESEYNKILSLSENHAKEDYTQVLLENRDEGTSVSTPSKKEGKRFSRNVILRGLFRATMYILPLIITLVMVCLHL